MLLSIIIPCYNDERYINDAIRSVKNIKHKEWECIIVNDGSTDKSEDVILKSIENDNRFRLVTTENNGVAKARNFGLSLASGDYCMFLDSDDILDSEYPAMAMRWMEKHPECPLYFGGVKCVGIINESIFPKWNGYDALLKEPCVFISAVLKKERALEIGGFSPDFDAFEDYEFWIRYLHKNSDNVKRVPVVMCTYRTRLDSRHFSHSNKELYEILSQIQSLHSTSV